jgi:CheY-like chemotaxis protein
MSLLPHVKPAVLITDDNAANRAAFTTILERDYRVTLAESGAEAVRLASARDFAVILLDVRMPLMDGFETAEALRRIERARYTPILFLSAYDQATIPVKCGYVPGVTDVLFGMVNEEILRLKVATYVAVRMRDDAMKRRLDNLEAILVSLQSEGGRERPESHVMRGGLAELRHLLDELKSEVYTPGGLDQLHFFAR